MDGLERDLNGQAEVLRIDFLSGVGRAVAPRYGVGVLPSLLLFDGSGRVVARQNGLIDAGAMRQAVADLQKGGTGVD